jgi:hypothetical protein
MPFLPSVSMFFVGIACVLDMRLDRGNVQSAIAPSELTIITDFTYLPEGRSINLFEDKKDFSSNDYSVNRQIVPRSAFHFFSYFCYKDVHFFLDSVNCDNVHKI